MASLLTDEVLQSLSFERSNRARGSVLHNDFYGGSSESADAPPGSLLRLERNVDPSSYFLPATTALSLMVYQSQTLLGTKVPVSAFILWPYCPRTLDDGHPIVAWAHGTSGFDANAAPSNQKNLWQHFQAPYQLALQGYVVVATDYAGLGVKKYADGKDIVHEYLAPPSQANDVINAVKAAKTAFQHLSERWVAIGQSQGGGAVWGIGQITANQSVPGYLGGVAISPYTSLLKDDVQVTEILAANMVPAISSLFPEFQPKDILTEEGERRVQLIHETDAGIASGVLLLTGTAILKPDWKSNRFIRKYHEMTSNGGKAIAGPLFIAHGTADPVLGQEARTAAVKATAKADPLAAIEYYSLSNVTHVSALMASQYLWMDWIADRFAGNEAEAGLRQHELKSAQPAEFHQKEQNWYLAPASKPWHAPGP